MAPGACTLSFHRRKTTPDIRLGSQHSFLILLQLTDVYLPPARRRRLRHTDWTTADNPVGDSDSTFSQVSQLSLFAPCTAYFAEQVPRTLASLEVCERHKYSVRRKRHSVILHHVSKTFYDVYTHPTILYLQYTPLVLYSNHLAI
jgi:hypothetical protein